LMVNVEQQIKEVLKSLAFLESLNSDEAKYLQNKLSTKKPIFEVDAPKWLKHAHRVFSACVVCCFFVLTTYVLFRFLPAYDSKRFSVLLMQAGIGVAILWFAILMGGITQQMKMIRGIKAKLHDFKGGLHGSN